MLDQEVKAPCAPVNGALENCALLPEPSAKKALNRLTEVTPLGIVKVQSAVITEPESIPYHNHAILDSTVAVLETVPCNPVSALINPYPDGGVQVYVPGFADCITHKAIRMLPGAPALVEDRGSEKLSLDIVGDKRPLPWFTGVFPNAGGLLVVVRITLP